MASHTVQIGVPHPLFNDHLAGVPGRFDVTRDGRRFSLLILPSEAQQPITLVVNWSDELKR